MYDPEGAWKRRGIIAAVLVLVLLAGAGIGFLVAGAGDESNTADPGTSNEPSADVDSSSTCGLPDGAQEVPSVGPDAEWEPIDDLLTPMTEEFGPGQESDGGVHSCFARNPTGALTALAVYFGDTNNIEMDQVELAQTRIAPGGGYEANVEQYEAGEGPQDPAGTVGQIAGFRFYDYSEDAAQIELVFELTGPETEGGFLGFTVDLEWVDGDWLVVLPEGLDFTVTQPRELAGRVVWAATPTPLDGGLDEGGEVESFSLDDSQLGGGMRAPVLAPIVGASDEVATDEEPAGAGDDDKGCRGLLSCAGAGIGAVNPGLGAAADAAGDVAGDAAGAAASSVAGSALEEIAAAAQEAAEYAIEELLTAWLSYPDPNVRAENSVTGWLQANLAGLVVFAMVFSVIAASIRLVVTQRFEHVRDLAQNLTRVLLVAGLTTALVALGLEVGDELAQYLLDQAKIDLEAEAATLIGFAGLTNPILLMFVALIVLATQLIQLALMVIRGAVVTLLAGALPLMAATSGTQAGKQAYTKAVAWLVAFVLYKPVAALIYAVAIRMTNPDQDVATRLSGLGLMILAIIALPALLRLVVSATGALGNTSGGGLVMAGMGAAVATGAVMATGGTAAAASGASGAMTGNAPMGGGGAGAGAGGAGGGPGGGPPPQGSKGSPVGGDGDAGMRPTLQPVGSALSAGDEGGTGTPRHDEGGPGGAGGAAQGAGQSSGGSESLRSFDSASRGAQAGGGAARAAGGSVGGASGASEGEENR